MRPAHGEWAQKAAGGGSNDRSKGAPRDSGASAAFYERSGPFRSTAATCVPQAPRTSAAAGAPSRRQGREAGLRRPPGRRSRRTRSTGGRSRARVAPAPPLPPPPPDPPAPRPVLPRPQCFKAPGEPLHGPGSGVKLFGGTFRRSQHMWAAIFRCVRTTLRANPRGWASASLFRGAFQSQRHAPRLSRSSQARCPTSLRIGSGGATAGLRKLRLEPLGLTPAA